MVNLNENALKSYDRNDPFGDFFVNIVREKISGFSTEFKFGRSVAVSATESVIWDGGGNYTFLTVAEKMDIVSDDPLDTALGTGARTIVIFGLDTNFNEIVELVVMDGTNIKTTQQSFIRIFRALVLTSGSNDPIDDANKGNITITGHDSSILQAKMLDNNGQTLMTVYTVPAGKTAYVTGASLSCGQGKACLFKAKFRNGPTGEYAFSVKFSLDLYQNSYFGTFATPLRIPEKTDALWTAQTSSGTIEAAASYGMILVDNEVI
jgi:hypothetical protein